MPPRRNEQVPPGEMYSSVRTDSLAPRLLFLCAFLTSFVLPNLIFSGEYFFSTLHLMKWAATLAPLAILGAAAGFRVLRFGTERTGFRLDGFAVIWLALLLYVTVQPFWSPPRSTVTFFQEWFFFGSLWLAYTLASLLADGKVVRALLWGALLNAAVSVLFAELQIRGLNGPYPFILPTPGNYIANTGQQNMFALWMAIAGLGGIFLFFSAGGARRLFANTFIVLLLIVVFWGLISSTSRSGILSLAAGFLVLSLFFLRLEGRRYLLKSGCVLLLFAAVLTVNVSRNPSTGAALASKMEDVIERPLAFAHRDSIWATSWTMFARNPIKGVGLGQYKWHYIDAQNHMLRRWPHFKWQYTHWAHNEFLQWMAEGGVVGAALMFFLWLWWMRGALGAFIDRTPLSPEAIWGSALVSLFFVNALWTRPFHRIENAVWLALAFAATNRELLPELIPTPPPERFERGGRLLGGVVCLVSLAGLLYLGEGILGDIALRRALAESEDPAVISSHLERAYRSPMVRDIAEKQRAYFRVHMGEKANDAEMLAGGLNDLIAYFEKQPHVQELSFLRQWAGKLDDPDFRRYMESFVYQPPASAD